MWIRAGRAKCGVRGDRIVVLDFLSVRRYCRGLLTGYAQSTIVAGNRPRGGATESEEGVGLSPWWDGLLVEDYGPLLQV